MRILLVAPDSGAGGIRHIEAGPARLDQIPEIRALTRMHRVTVLSGPVTEDDVFDACQRDPYDIIHFASHSDEERVYLSGSEDLAPARLEQLIGLSGCRLMFFNSCKSARLAALMVRAGLHYAIATTVELPDAEAWQTVLGFYTQCKRQMMQVKEPKLVDIPTAFGMAIGSDGTYMLLQAAHPQSQLEFIVDELRKLREAIEGRDKWVWRFMAFLGIANLIEWTIHLLNFWWR